MADKQQNVFVNFKFNTAEIEKATQLTNRANDAANKLQNTAEKSGKSLDNAFRQPVQSIGYMQLALARLKTQIEVSSDPKRVKHLSDQYKDLKTQLDKATKSAFDNSKAIKELSQESAKTAGVMGQLGQALGLVFSAAVIRQVVDTTLELARLAGNAEGVERAFSRAFPNSVQVLNELRTATHGTVNDLELMQRTLQATNLGVAVEQLPVLFEFAAARAQQTGESVDYLVDSIVRGIGRKSILVLDNLGLSATRLKEQFNGASLASQSVADVTRGVAAIAKVELEKMGGDVETTATQESQLEAQWQSLRVTVAKKVESGGIIQFFKDSLAGLESILKGSKQLEEERAKSAAAQQADNFVQSKAFKDQENNSAKQIDMLLEEIIERQRLVRLRDFELRQAKEKRKEIVDDLTVINLRAATEAIDQQIVSQQRSKNVLEESIP